MTQSTSDMLDTLAEIAPDSPLAQARATRDAATRHAQGSYEALFSHTESSDLPLALRFFIAEKVSGWHQNTRLQHFYAQRLADFPAPTPNAALDRALEHAERLTHQPVAAQPEQLQALQQAGWTEDDIVTLSQLVAFVSFQSRLLHGYRLLAGHAEDPALSAPAAVAGRWHTQPQTHSGKTAPDAFTQAELSWEPWLPAKPLAAFTADEQAILARFGHTDSDYFRLLGRNLPVLEQRTLTDKGIFYTSGGLPHKDRELAARWSARSTAVFIAPRCMPAKPASCRNRTTRYSACSTCRRAAISQPGRMRAGRRSSPSPPGCPPRRHRPTRRIWRGCASWGWTRWRFST